MGLFSNTIGAGLRSAPAKTGLLPGLLKGAVPTTDGATMRGLFADLVAFVGLELLLSFGAGEIPFLSRAGLRMWSFPILDVFETSGFTGPARGE